MLLEQVLGRSEIREDIDLAIETSPTETEDNDGKQFDAVPGGVDCAMGVLQVYRPDCFFGEEGTLLERK